MAQTKSLLQNYAYNLVKTLNSVLFPVVSFSYSARILGVNGVGRVNFAKSVVAYFAMLATLGMNYYGTREAAKLRGDREGLSQFCGEMLAINGCTTLLAYALLALAALSLPVLRGYGALLPVCGAAIALQGLGMEWLYQAMEEYRYIALRSALFQIGALLAMFAFVRDEADVIPYAAITLAATSGSYILNFVNARSFIRWKRPALSNIRRHLRPLLWLFAMAVSVELYTVLDSTMLGFLRGDAAVGLYTAAIKVERLVNTLITSAGMVLIPRLSLYVGRGEVRRMDGLMEKAYNYVFMLSIPAAVGLYALSDDIILLFSGSQFAAAGFTMRLLTPIVIFIPFSVMTNQQAFVPLGKEKLILLSTSAGAAVNFALNLLLIPRWAENGAALATVIAEATVALVCLRNGSAQFRVGRFFRSYHQYWLAAVAIPVASYLLKAAPLPRPMRMAAVVLLSGLGYGALLLLFKNRYLIDLWRQVRRRTRGGGGLR